MMINNVFKLYVSIILLSFQVVPVLWAYDKPQEVTLVFHPDGYPKSEYPLRISLYEYEYNKDLWMGSNKDRNKFEGVEAFLVDAMSIYKHGDINEIIDLWADEDKKKIRAMMKQIPGLLEKNRNFHKRISDTRFISKYYYGPYRIIFVQHKYKDSLTGDHLIKAYIILAENGAFYLTNKLMNGPFYNFLDMIQKQVEKEG